MGTGDEVVGVGEHHQRCQLDRARGLLSEACERFDEAVDAVELARHGGTPRDPVDEVGSDDLPEGGEVVAVERIERGEVGEHVGVQVRT